MVSDVVAHTRSTDEVERLELLIWPGAAGSLGRSPHDGGRSTERQIMSLVQRRPWCAGQHLIPDTEDVDVLREDLERATEG